VRLVFRQIAIIVIVIILASTSVMAADIVTFKGTGTSVAGTPLMLTGKLTKPIGDGPFPTVVLLHGCGGISNLRDAQWAKRLASWGYVALQVDSFGPRGLSNVCTDVPLAFSIVPKRAQDTYDAKSYLSELPFVDRNRIGVMGWSHGGITLLSMVGQKRDNSFRSAIAFYPLCYRNLTDLNAPLLILIGEKDDWTHAWRCSETMPPAQIGHEVILKIYPDSYHGFDAEGVDFVIAGHRIRYNQAAAADAILQVKTFLTKYLK
jgi:dienelactone hydrolase